jgi:hypothetical protein
MIDSAESTLDQAQQIALDRLIAEFAGRVPPATIEAYVSEAVPLFQDATVHQYVGIFAYRAARARLEALAEPRA